MIAEGCFKKSFIFSLCGHAALFFILGFSFGAAGHNPGYAGVNFNGQYLRHSDFTAATSLPSAKEPLLLSRELLSRRMLPRQEGLVFSFSALKPGARFLDSGPKEAVFLLPAAALPPGSGRKESVVMLYPQLPYHFILYFRDRQRAHIEVMFNVASASAGSRVQVKRKISSGDLEADLLSLRYISHYLFIQKLRFPPDKWQSVKIDLSAAQ